jgi:hypothetical protein
MLLVLPFSLLSLLLGLSVFTANVPALTAGRFQLWRLLTALVDQGQFFTLLFVTLTLATQMPAQEIRAGSLAFLAHLLTTGLLVGALYAVIGLLLGLAGARAPGLEVLVGFGFMPAMGLWPVLLAATTTSVLADPTGSSSFLCFTLPNRVFPLSAWARGGAGRGARARARAPRARMRTRIRVSLTESTRRANERFLPSRPVPFPSLPSPPHPSPPLPSAAGGS